MLPTELHACVTARYVLQYGNFAELFKGATELQHEQVASDVSTVLKFLSLSLAPDSQSRLADEGS